MSTFLRKFGLKTYEFQSNRDIQTATSLYYESIGEDIPDDKVFEVFESKMEEAGIEFTIEIDDFVEFCKSHPGDDVVW